MQNGSLENGVDANHINDQQHDEVEQLPANNESEAETSISVNEQTFVENAEPQYGEDNDNDAPPNKKRKLTDPPKGKASTGPRPISPPWKKITVEGPTSFVEEGRRKSSRTNYVPVELQAQRDKRQTRAAIFQNPPAVKSKYGGAYKMSPLTASSSIQTPSNVKRPPSAGRPASDTASRSPSKPSQLPSSQASQAQTPLDNPPTPKRSHKKKIRPISPQLADLTPASNPYQTRRGARTSDVTAAQVNGHGPSTNGWHEYGNGLPENAAETTTDAAVTPRPQRFSLKLRMPTVHVQHPAHVLPERKYESFREWFEKEGRLGLEVEDKDPHLTEKEVIREARLRISISEAAKPGGLLSEERCQLYRPERFEPPPRLYTHQDRLVSHALYFKHLMDVEHVKHKKNAKECAEKAAAVVRRKEEESYHEWKQAQPKTEEDLAQEQVDAAKEVWEQIREDIKQKWLMINQMVEAARLQRWQDEQDRLGKEALNEAIEKSRGLLDRRRRGGSVMSSDEESGDDEASGSEESGLGSDAESVNEDNMSSSQSESEDEDFVLMNEDEGLTQEELRVKYAAIPSIDEDKAKMSDYPVEDSMISDRARGTSTPDQTRAKSPASVRAPRSHSPLTLDDQLTPTVPLEEVDDALMDDSDASTTMDSEMDDSDGSSSEEEDDDDGSEEEEGSTGLLGFFGRTFKNGNGARYEQGDGETKGAGEAEDKNLDHETEEVSLVPDVRQGPTPTATPAATSEEPHPKATEEMELDNAGDTLNSLGPNHHRRDASTELTLAKLQERQTSPLANLRSLMQDASLPNTPVSNNPLKTPIPSLLRGTLREYQHYGLDWLAGLYAAGTNGILADEMGLGKTIQTIALLAHLAVEHEVWGPHLIVVPTSVMLNWEIEFKKFLPGFKVLTYYGTQEERKKKRAGWLDNDRWNVWITSYTLITNDQQVFKRKAWHYMILDEAHNIKNFQSLRWQTLLTFNTKARLLLTGTPLQNNLTELWSLLFFLMPTGSAEKGIGGFANLQEFTDWFRKPVEQILEHGRDILDHEARKLVDKLHDILRPYLLRRLKADVEKQMPGKYEHVVYCKLSKRQRYLYDGFMSRTQTRETLASGNTFSIMNALMQLRKVCNHPDLFETRQIVTSFAMPKSAVADFEIKELLVRRKLLQEGSITTVDLNMINLLPGANEQLSALDTNQRQRLGALGAIRQLTSQQWSRVNPDLPFDGSSIASTLTYYENTARRSRFEDLRHTAYKTSLRSQRRPLYSHSLMEQLRFGIKPLPHQPKPERRYQLSEWYSRLPPVLNKMLLSLSERSNALEPMISKFACVTPSVVATDIANLTLCQHGIETVQTIKELCPSDNPYHEAQMRLSIAFPDKRLLQYDCGKLQRLDTLLRTLQAGGHRALIFTQMTRVLDILEQFLNIHGHRYLRLDGATKIEQRQILTDRFNNDDRILAFILSSRSGGIGINLTGADTVIFYDLDWNPAMDKQCQDRCHRIGQTRDVHIYRFVSEYTIEANILRKANQKRMLDDVVIQEGEFTTDYFNNGSVKDIIGDEAFDEADAEANAAMDRVLGRGAGRVFEAVEDQEDIAAAKVAEKELAQNQDAADFDEKAATSTRAATPKSTGPPTPREMILAPKRFQGDVEMTMTLEAAESGLVAPGAMLSDDVEEIEELPSCDDYMMRLMEWELKDIPVQPPVDKNKKKMRKGKEHTLRKR
ncbi:hypothetical protein N7G274_005351 [Stereocaulon virgatum]|uniref:Uncharacterized protein n=1 Tax=Stereocaulon virgatum TaxID=373712 RepID=A0ABR4A909_9LECA